MLKKIFEVFVFKGAMYPENIMHGDLSNLNQIAVIFGNCISPYFYEIFAQQNGVICSSQIT